MVPILQYEDACYCEFYRAVNFEVRETVTIPCLTLVRNTVAIRLRTQQEACSTFQLLAPSKKYSLFKEKGLLLLLLLSMLHTSTFVCA